MMQRYFFLLVITILTGFTLAQNQKKVFPYDYTTKTFENGLKVIVIPMDSPGLVSYYSVVRTGSRDEWEPGKSGFAHFFEHMMFRGTETYPGPIYDSIVTSLGADANAYTSDDLTVYHLNFAKEDLEKVIELESDRFQNLSYDEREFQTEAGAIYGEYRKNRTSPWSIAFEKLHDMAFDKHTYKHTTMGFEEDIKDMPNQFEYSRSFYKRYYRPENIVIVVVGDIKVNPTIDLLQKYYKDWQPGYVKPKIENEPEQTAERTAEVSYPGKTLPLMIISYKNDAFNVANKKQISAMLLADLAFGSTSDIYKKLVLSEQKAQFVQAEFTSSRDPKLYYIYTMVKKEDDLDYVKNEIFNTIEYYQNNLPNEKKLNDLKKRIKYSFLMNLDNPSSVAGILPNFITLTGGIEVIDQLYNKLDEITPQDVQEAAKYYFVPEKRNVVTVKGEK